MAPKPKNASELYQSLRQHQGGSERVSLFQKQAPLLLLEREEYYKEKIIALMKEAYGAYETLFADELDENVIVEAFSGGGLFVSQRLLVIRQVNKIYGGAKGKPAEKLGRMLEGGEAQDTILLSQERSVPAKVQNPVKANGQVIMCWPPFANQVPGWLHSRARDYGLRLSQSAVQLLQQRFGNQLMELDHALQRLAVYQQGQNSPVSDADVRYLFPIPTATDIFILLDEVFFGAFARAIERLHFILNSGQSVVAVLALLSKEISNLHRAKIMLREGASEADVVNNLQIPNIQKQKFQRKIHYLKEEDLRYLIGRFIQIDRTLKGNLSGSALSELETALYYISSAQKK